MSLARARRGRFQANYWPGFVDMLSTLLLVVTFLMALFMLANYIVTLRKDVLTLSRACGAPHPALITADQLELLDGRFGATTVAELFGYGRGFGLPSATDCDEVRRLMSV